MYSCQQSMNPVLKWAGGKIQLLPIINAMLPNDYCRYYEPFVGGAAVFLSLAPSNAIINDVNIQLINLYLQIKNSVEEIIYYINFMDNKACDLDYYLEMRRKYNKKIQTNTLDAECAALLVWINKHCFNGLYRVNSKGLFNVPYNNKIQGRSIDEENIRNISRYLRTKDISITCSDFEDTCKTVKANDFVYFDSPYIPQSNTADFTSYAKTGFTEEDHRRLASLYKKLDATGAKLMLSNNDVDMVYELYSDFKITRIEVKRMINSNASKRTGREVIITNY